MIHLPEAFISQTKSLLGLEETEALIKALSEEAPTSIRVNPNKATAISGESVPWCETGYYLSERPSFTLDPLFHAGAYYVQEASSMFLSQVIKALPEEPRRVLDLCAAPGGKSTLWRAELPEQTLLVANEPIHRRAMILAENLAKWGHPDVIVTEDYPKSFSHLPGCFDVIAADVPCSGEGMFRKDPGAIDEWSKENVDFCAQRQFEIISDVWPALREGGFLVYSTCTFNRAENEDNIERICRELGAETLPIPIKEEWKIRGSLTKDSLHVYHFFPHCTRGEGIFFALLRKTSAAAPEKKPKGRPELVSQQLAHQLSAWVDAKEPLAFLISDNNMVQGVKEDFLSIAWQIKKQIKTVRTGINIAEIKGKKLIPQTDLALSTIVSPETFPKVVLNYEQAIAYLRHEALNLDTTERGYLLATYEDRNLGFLNNLGSRANNLYPSEWRIRKQC